PGRGGKHQACCATSPLPATTRPQMPRHLPGCAGIRDWTLARTRVAWVREKACWAAFRKTETPGPNRAGGHVRMGENPPPGVRIYRVCPGIELGYSALLSSSPKQ